MVITCPKCETSFGLPVNAFKPGRKARCSQCHHVFPMTEPVTETLSSTASLLQPDSKPDRIKGLFSGRTAIYTVIAIICIFGLLGSSYLLYSAFQEKKAVDVVKERRMLREEEAKLRQEQDKSLSGISLVNVRQTVVVNQRFGPLVVIEGFAQNNFETPRSYIEVEAKLFDKEGKSLAEARQSCGISLTVTQLEVLSLDELGKALNNSVEILSRNVGVQHGEQIPFVVVFRGLPKELYSYEVRPVHALIEDSK